MARIFLSHSSADNAQAVALRDWLIAQGWNDLFFDLDPERGIAAGERWERALNEAASRCEAILFLVSRAWLSSRWCVKEFNLARRLNKRLFGVLIEDIATTDLPPDLTRAWQLVRLGSGRDHQMFHVILPITGEETDVTFSAEGLRRLRTGLLKAGLDARYFAWPPVIDPDRPPYRGLRPLEAEDAGIFFGRDAPIVEALDRLRGLREAAAPRLLVILGASGAGKSSFLRAGLMPRLQRDDRNFLPLPVVRPGRAALSSETGLVHSLEEALKAKGLMHTRAQIKEAVANGTEAVGSLLSELVTNAQIPDLSDEPPVQVPTVVLAIDQGEELFLAEGAEEAKAFLTLLKDLLLAKSLDVIALVTIRSDSYEPLQAERALDGINQHTFSLTSIPKGAYQDVIEGPPRRLADRRALTIEPQLTAALLADVEAGEGKDALPLLAFTLERLYLECGGDGDLKLSEYEQLGRIRGAIEAAVEGALSAADANPRIPKDRQARLALLRRGLIPWLAGIDPDTGAPRRLMAHLSEIPTEARPLIDLLTEQHLLTTDVAKETGEITIEPAHEALLRQWGLLEDWLDEDFEDLATLEGVRRAARDWAANAKYDEWLAHTGARFDRAEEVAAREEFATSITPTERAYLAAVRAAEDARQQAEFQRFKRDRRRSRIITYGSAITAFIMGFLGLVMYGQWQQALRQESLLLSDIARQQINDGDAVTGTLLALEALKDPTSTSLSQLLRPFVPAAQGVLDEAVQPGTWRDTVLAGHQGAIWNAAFSRNGSRIVTASRDNTARIWDAATGASIVTLSGHEDTVYRAVFSPDASRVVTASWDGTVQVWDAATGASIVTLSGHEDKVFDAAFSPDGTRIVTAAFDKTARVWNADTGATLVTLKGHQDILRSAAFSPDGSRVVTISDDQTARVWDAVTGADIASFVGHGEVVRSAAFSPDGTRIVTASDDNTARIWDAATGKELAILEGHKQDVLTAAFSPDGKRIVTASWDKTARVWDAVEGHLIDTLVGHEAVVWSAAFSRDGARIVTSSADYTARVWDAIDGTVIAILAGHQHSVRSAAFSRDGKRIVTASFDGTARVWGTIEGVATAIFVGHEGTVWSASFSPDGSRIVTASGDQSVRLWNADTGELNDIVVTHSKPFRSVAFSPDGERIVTTSDDHKARVWDAATGEVDLVFSGHQDRVRTAAFSPDGAQIVTASEDQTAQIWDAHTGTIIRTLAGHDGRVLSATFSRDGKRIVTASDDKTARVWDTATGKTLVTLVGPESEMWSAAFSPDGTRIVTSSNDKNARVWDAATGDILMILIGHDNLVRHAAFSPDGTRIVTASSDRTARVWDADTGAVIATLSGHMHIVWHAAFSRDGKRIVTTSWDNTARVWNAPPDAAILIDRTKRRLTRCLTPSQRRRFNLESTIPDWCYAQAKWPYHDPTMSSQPPLLPIKRLRNGYDWLTARLQNARATVVSLSTKSP